MIRFTVLILITIFAYEYGHAAEDPADRQIENWITLENLGIDKNDPPANWSAKESHELLVDKMNEKAGSHQKYYILLEELLYMLLPNYEFVHLYPNDSINKEYHAIANATKDLFLKLPTMANMSSIMQCSISKAAEEEDLRDSMAVLFASIEQSIKEDSSLYDQYVDLKEKAKNRTASVTDLNVLHYEIQEKTEDAVRLIAQGLNTPTRKSYLAHFKFANETRKNSSTSQKNFELARSVLELAKKPEKGALVQRKYDEALEETAQSMEDMNPTDYPHYLEYIWSNETNAILMEKLSDNFEKNSELSSDIEDMKKIVRDYDD